MPETLCNVAYKVGNLSGGITQRMINNNGKTHETKTTKIETHLFFNLMITRSLKISQQYACQSVQRKIRPVTRKSRENTSVFMSGSLCL